MNDETKAVLVKLAARFNEWSEKCDWHGEYGDGLARAYETCAEEIEDILDGISTI